MGQGVERGWESKEWLMHSVLLQSLESCADKCFSDPRITQDAWCGIREVR